MTREQKLIKELLISNRCGVHLRVGSMLAQKAKEFTSEIRLRKGSYVADCRSVLDLLSLGAFQGDAVVLEVVGADAEAALNAIASLFNARFFEDEVEERKA
jgi:phosphotransferase system HPr (HPr) family protein